jgi:hypothetical protein
VLTKCVAVEETTRLMPAVTVATVSLSCGDMIASSPNATAIRGSKERRAGLESVNFWCSFDRL